MAASLERRRQNSTAVHTDQQGRMSLSCDTCANGNGNGNGNGYVSASQKLKQTLSLGPYFNLSFLENRMNNKDGNGESKYHSSPRQRNKAMRTYLVMAAFCGFMILSHIRQPYGSPPKKLDHASMSQQKSKLSSQAKLQQQFHQHKKSQELRGAQKQQQQQQQQSSLTSAKASSDEAADDEVDSTPQEKSLSSAEQPQQHDVASIAKPPNSELLLHEDDYIYKRDLTLFDAAPIIMPEYKLVFFSIPKVACTTFKFLFRRMMGIKDWDNQDYKLILPHNPHYNNLKYLWDYDMEQANEMMTSPEWTRAIFVREPKQRLLSAFLDKAIGNDGWHVLKTCCHEALECKGIDGSRKDVSELLEMCHLDAWDSRRNNIVPQWNLDIPCCKETKECREKFETFEGFLETIATCHDEHWDPQSHRMEEKYWPYINFVGHMESMGNDTESLLKKIGAWDKWGATGWGPHGNLSITAESDFSQSHTTGSLHKIYQWYSPERERLVESFYSMDYENPLFGFPMTNLTLPFDVLTDGELIKHQDKVYAKDDWDGSPIVVEKYKLIFFSVPKIGGTIWKQACRRMMGLRDWREIGGDKGLPHDPEKNGLKYLYDYPIGEAEAMFKSEEWTKAIFTRSPKDRFLSVYNEMSHDWDQVDRRCCPHEPGCSTALQTISGLLDLAENCYSAHWIPISHRMEEKYWPYINFVGLLENAREDSQKLLEKIGAWDEIGKSGWGESGIDRIFADDTNAYDAVLQALSMYNPVVDKKLDEFYKVDFENNYITLASRKVYAMEKEIAKHT